MSPFELGLIGRPLGHSHSAEYFNNLFERLQIDARYINMELADISELPEVLAGHQQLIGFNVTAPYKREIIPYLTSLSDTAAEIGAVNTVRVHRKGNRTELEGHNTDVEGFRESIRPALTSARPHRALVLGSGGAALAVCRGLKDLSVESLIVSRHKGADRITYADIDRNLMAEHDVIINATPLGTFQQTDTAPPLDYSLLTPQHVCFDLVYNPPLTCFLRNSLKQGAVIRNGLQMLYLQAEAAYKFWTSDSVI